MKKIPLSLLISIIGLICQICGVISEPGSLSQKIFFTFGVSLLGVGAIMDKHEMFTVMQIVALIGVFLGYFPDISEIIVYSIMGIALIGALVYLQKHNYYKKNSFALLGVLSLFLLALGFSTNPAKFPLLFQWFLAFGGLMMAIYSGLELFILKFRLAIIFLILNLIFMIKPILFIADYYGITS